MIIFILILAFFAMITVLLMIDTVQSYGARKILKNKKVPCNIKNILVLGIKSKNKEVDNEMLADRLITAIEVNKENGNECTILLDKSGVSTYDSIYWAKEVFHIESMIIITNEHHLPRALYLSK
ncbi:MAG: YdcF family protein [Clostridium sp.]|nr:YdcF family protein [Clostridium sp.]